MNTGLEWIKLVDQSLTVLIKNKNFFHMPKVPIKFLWEGGITKLKFSVVKNKDFVYLKL